MLFRVLGCMEVVDDVGSPLPLGSARERLVLAQLLLEADRVVPADRLIDLLWSDPPPTARQQLQNLMAGLRRRLDNGPARLISTRPFGYQLHLGDHDIDLLQFRRLVALARNALLGARPEDAVPFLTSARELWRGPALTDVTSAATSALEPMVQAMREERIGAVDQLLDVLAALGRHEQLLKTAAAELDVDPWNERLHAHRLRALASTGRRSEAAREYRRLHRQFADELGVSPGADLADLNTQILCDGDAMPDEPAHRPRTVPRELPAQGWKLIGRDDLISRVAHDVAASADGWSPVVTLVGASGVGKTAAALAVGHRLSGHFPDGTLYAALDRRGAADRGDGLGRSGADRAVIRFLRALNVPNEHIPSDHDERVALYRSIAADKRLLVVIDGAPTEAEVRALLPTGAHSATIVTSQSMLAGLIGARRHTVTALDETHGTALLVAVSGRESSEDRHALSTMSAHCGHLPLALCVVGSRIATDPHLDLTELGQRLATEHHRLDELEAGDVSVRASIVAAVADLDQASTRLFGRLAVAGATDWPAWVLAHLHDETATLRSTTDVLIDRHLLVPIGRDRAGQARLTTHPLVLDHARELLRVGEGEGAVADLEIDVALRWAELAERAAAHLDPGERLRDRNATGSVPPAPAAADLPAEWFEAERANLKHSIGILVRHGQWESAARCALATSAYLAIRAYDDERAEILHAVADEYPVSSDQALHVELLAALFATHAQRRELSQLSSITDRMLRVSERSGDHASRLRALSQAGWAARARSDYDAAMRHLADAAVLAQDIGDESALAHVNGQRGVVLRNLGRARDADPLLHAVVEHTRLHGSQRNLAIWLVTHSEALIDVERWDEAHALLSEADDLAQDLGDDLGRANIALAMARVSLGRGELDASVALMRRAGEWHPDAASPTSSDVQLLQIDLHVASGSLTEASALANRAAGDIKAHLEPTAAAAAQARRAAILRALDQHDAADAAAESAVQILERASLPQTALRLPGWLYPAPQSGTSP